MVTDIAEENTHTYTHQILSRPGYEWPCKVSYTLADGEGPWEVTAHTHTRLETNPDPAEANKPTARHCT